ncbi:MAG TPA: hypothetical protein VMH27_19280 [Puia sp.]|nr:hypothetical protein [Puia sp.]
MNGWGFLTVLLLASAGGSVCAQTTADSTFSLFFNSSLNFNHANDPHINRWLKEYGYPTEPHVPTSMSFEAAAMPANSRLLYSVHLSAITNASNLTAFNLGAGLFEALVKSKDFLFLLGGSMGYHADIVSLDGNLPPAYEDLSVKYNTPLALRRSGISFAPMLRIFFYPVRFGKIARLGLIGGAGYVVDLNSNWRLGYYSGEHGRYNHFRKLVNKPNDQRKVSEHGICLSAGISLRFDLH